MSFYVKYLQEISTKIQAVDEAMLSQVSAMLRETQQRKTKVIIAGNGGSAAIASHVAVDLTKTVGVRAINFNEADLITCLANDFGYEQWVAKALEHYADAGDLVILISSSGRSANIVNGAAKAKEMGLDVVTFSGFDKNNALRKSGTVNFWVDSRDYNVVEMTHHVWLLAAADQLVHNDIKEKVKA